MARSKDPQHVLAFVGLLTSAGFDCSCISEHLAGSYGDVVLRSTPQPFTHTTYYNEEMGDRIFRQWWVLDGLRDPVMLFDMKHDTNILEQKHCNQQGGRRVNIDPGIVSMNNVVLASTKNYSHRIYLGEGIYAEVTLIYRDKTFTILDWTYPDYKEPTTIDFFNQARTLLKDKLVHES